MAKNISFHQEALANYEEWITKDPDNITYQARAEYHRQQIERLRDKNRRASARRRSDPHAGTRRKIEWLDKRIARKEKTMDYYREHRESNPGYYDVMMSHAELELASYKTQRRALITTIHEADN